MKNNEKIISLISELWLKYPAFGFGQLLFNFAFSNESLFEQSDYETIRRLEDANRRIDRAVQS